MDKKNKKNTKVILMITGKNFHIKINM